MRLLAIVFSLLLVSACQRSTYYASHDAMAKTSIPQSLGGVGSGEGFEGRVSVTTYFNTDPSAPCQQSEPNQVIKTFQLNTSLTAQLTVKDCVPLNPPIPLTSSDLQFPASSPGSLVYQGLIFNPVPSSSVDSAALSGWTLASATLDPNPVPPVFLPDALTPGQLLIEDTSLNYHQATGSFGQAVLGINYTAAVYIRTGSRNFALLTIEDALNSGTRNCGCGFDLSAGASNGSWSLGGSTPPICGIQSAGVGGWYMITTSCAPNASGSRLGIALGASDIATGNGSYQGNGSPMYYFGGATISW